MALIHIAGKSYELVHENRNGWNPEAFRNRYSEVLERYDFIIGDWGYNQLRLKGFFRDNHQKANKDCSFSGVTDYINEYCNFGCAYFILEKKHGAGKEPGEEDLVLNEMPATAVRLDGLELRAAAETAASATADVPSGAETGASSSREQHARETSSPAHRNRQRSQSSRPEGQDVQGHHGGAEGRHAAGEGRHAAGESRRSAGEGRHAAGEGRHAAAGEGRRHAAGESRHAGGEGRQAAGEGRQSPGEGRRRERDQHYRKSSGNNRNNEHRSNEQRAGEHRGKKSVKTAAAAIESSRGSKDAGRS